MTPRAFRALPRLDQVEMMAHMQELSLRKAHQDHIGKVVGDLKDPTEEASKGKPPPHGRGRGR